MILPIIYQDKTNLMWNYRLSIFLIITIIVLFVELLKKINFNKND